MKNRACYVSHIFENKSHEKVALKHWKSKDGCNRKNRSIFLNFPLLLLLTVYKLIFSDWLYLQSLIKNYNSQLTAARFSLEIRIPLFLLGDLYQPKLPWQIRILSDLIIIQACQSSCVDNAVLTLLGLRKNIVQ